MPAKQANCLDCGTPYQVGWVLNKHRKQCVLLPADTFHRAAQILDDNEVRDEDEMATELHAEDDVLLPDHDEDDELLAETLSIKEHKHKWRLSPKLIDVIKFLGATSRGLPMPQGNVNTMLEYVKSLQGGGAKNLPKCSKTAWRILNTVSYVRLYIQYKYICKCHVHYHVP